MFRGIHRINITGGEPTLHPEFARMATQFKDLFRCDLLKVETNGSRIRQHEGVLEHFDAIHFTDYGDNHELVDWLRLRCKELNVFVAGHVPRSVRNSGKTCDRGRAETVAYANGRIFGCPVGQGIVSAESLVPRGDWRERVQDLPLPCADCWFSW